MPLFSEVYLIDRSSSESNSDSEPDDGKLKLSKDDCLEAIFGKSAGTIILISDKDLANNYSLSLVVKFSWPLLTIQFLFCH